MIFSALTSIQMQGGILSIDAAPGGESLVATAGADGVVVLFDHSAGRIKASLTGHSKKVNGERFPCLLYHEFACRGTRLPPEESCCHKSASKEAMARRCAVSRGTVTGTCSGGPGLEVAPALLGDGYAGACMR